MALLWWIADWIAGLHIMDVGVLELSAPDPDAMADEDDPAVIVVDGDEAVDNPEDDAEFELAAAEERKRAAPRPRKAPKKLAAAPKPAPRPSQWAKAPPVAKKGTGTAKGRLLAKLGRSTEQGGIPVLSEIVRNLPALGTLMHKAPAPPKIGCNGKKDPSLGEPLWRDAER